MIRSAKLSEINDIVAIAKACAAKMVENGIFQWNEHYPSPAIFQEDVARKELYVLEDGKKIVGTIVLSTMMDAEYVPINWLTPNRNNLYIHRLSVHPSHQGMGYAQKLMAFAEDHARKNAFASIRLDTFSKNLRNQSFYSKRGYQKLGDIHFPKQSEYPFHCYELVL